MNKNYLVSLEAIFLFALSIYPQQADSLASKETSLIQTPQKVYRLCYNMESKDWYKNRERFWKAEKINNPQNEEAWRNYYFASRYARMGTDEAERKKLLHSIFASDTYYKKYK